MGFLKSLSKYCILKKVRDKANEPEEKWNQNHVEIVEKNYGKMKEHVLSVDGIEDKTIQNNQYQVNIWRKMFVSNLSGSQQGVEAYFSGYTRFGEDVYC